MNDIPVGKIGDTYSGIEIIESNRATRYERWKSDVEILQQYAVSNYTSKGIKAVLYGIEAWPNTKFAVFVQTGFLRDIRGN